MMLALCIGSVVWVGGSHDVGLVYRECGVGWGGGGGGGSHVVGLVYRECGVGLYRECGVGWGAHMILALCIGVWGSHDVGLVYRECGVGWVAHMMLALCIESVVWGGWLT